MAESKTLFSFCLFLILILSSYASSSPPPPLYQIDFDTYLLLFQWDPATCSDKILNRKCSRLPYDKFSIGGLWAISLSPYQILGHCRGSCFNRHNIRPIEFGLNQNWPDVISGENLQLWEKEWITRGTCTEKYFNQLDYFSFALEHFSDHNLIRILAANNIVPSSFRLRRDTVDNAISRAIGVKPAFRCNVNNLANAQQLHEIGLCFSKETERLRNCPLRLSTCQGNFYWFPYMKTLYGYFQVVFQWQPASCRDSRESRRCVQNPELRFSINGVWPTTRSEIILEHCNGSVFDPNQVISWPDLFSRRNEELWESEWRNYGTCSEDQFNQPQYFGLGMHAVETIDLISILNRNNITPNGRTYRSQDIENAIIKEIGAKPYVLCNEGRIDGFRRYQLHQIIMCYDSYGRKVQDCPLSYFPSRCTNAFGWFV